MTQFESIIEKQLYVPPLSELSEVIMNGLLTNFVEVEVSVVTCPDLRLEPYFIAERGLCGKTAICDIGGKWNMEYPENNRKYSWDMKDICDNVVKIPNALVIGPGATSPECSFLNVNSELITNTIIDGYCNTKEAYVGSNGECRLVDYKSNEFSCLANLFFTEGLEGEVIKVRAGKRIGSKNFVSCMRETIGNHYNDQVGIGGVFIVSSGKIKGHVMPDYPSENLITQQLVDNWLRFYHVDAPVTCVSVFVSKDPDGLDLRLEHTHFFSNREDGGHYHYDITPDEVVYEGYFYPSERLFRIDRSKKPEIKN